MLFRGYISAQPVSLKVDSCSADLDVKLRDKGHILKSFLFTSMGRCKFKLF